MTIRIGRSLAPAREHAHQQFEPGLKVVRSYGSTGAPRSRMLTVAGVLGLVCALSALLWGVLVLVNGQYLIRSAAQMAAMPSPAS